MANFGRQRLVINHSQADLSDRPVFYISNRLSWQAPGIMRIRRHRWPVKVYHEVGRAEGLDHASRKSGTFKPLNDMSAWSQYCIANCVPPDMTWPSETSFNANSGWTLRGVFRFGVERPEPKACEAWRSLSVPAWHRASRCGP